MEASELIIDIHQEFLQLQAKFNLLLKVIDASSGKNLLTRREAAKLLGKTVRQLDRDCIRFGIPKICINNGVRLRKADILFHIGELNDPNENERISELERITRRHL